MLNHTILFMSLDGAEQLRICGRWRGMFHEMIGGHHFSSECRIASTINEIITMRAPCSLLVGLEEDCSNWVARSHSKRKGDNRSAIDTVR